MDSSVLIGTDSNTGIVYLNSKFWGGQGGGVGSLFFSKNGKNEVVPGTNRGGGVLFFRK